MSRSGRAAEAAVGRGHGPRSAEPGARRGRPGRCSSSGSTAKKPVTFQPIIALGLDTKTHGGWYPAMPKSCDPTMEQVPERTVGVRFQESSGRTGVGQVLRRRRSSAAGTTFDPGNQPFGLWVSNDNFNEAGLHPAGAGVQDQPAAQGPALQGDDLSRTSMPRPGRLVPNSYIIGWEYSTNDDFQDVVTQIDNVRLLPADPPLPGILAAGAEVSKLAGGFKFVEGPAWNFKDNALYFSRHPGRADRSLRRRQDRRGQRRQRPVQRSDVRQAGQADRLRARRAARVAGEPAASPARTSSTTMRASGSTAPTICGSMPRAASTSPIRAMARATIWNWTRKRSTTSPPTARSRASSTTWCGPTASPCRRTARCSTSSTTGRTSCTAIRSTGPGKIGKGERIAYVQHPDGMTVDRGAVVRDGCAGVCVLGARRQMARPDRDAGAAGQLHLRRPGLADAVHHRPDLALRVDTLTRGWHVHLDGPPPALRRHRRRSEAPVCTVEKGR